MRKKISSLRAMCFKLLNINDSYLSLLWRVKKADGMEAVWLFELSNCRFEKLICLLRWGGL